MTKVDEHGRPEPLFSGQESDVLVSFLEWQRSTLEWKTRGLEREGLSRTIASSSMTLGGILKHMAWVEDHWFSHVLHDRERSELWSSVDWSTHSNWEWTSAVGDAPDELRSMWSSFVEASRTALDEALPSGGLDQLAKRTGNVDGRPSLRWIILHMIEEYARHNGHADLIREAVDGQTGE